MSRRHLAAVLVAAAAAFGGAAPVRAADAIDDLVADLGAPEDHVREQARARLATRGADAIPALVRTLEGTNARARIEAARVLGALGEAAAGAQEALRKAATSEDPALADAARAALASIQSAGPSKPATVPELAADLSSRDTAKRVGAIRQLARVTGPAARDAATVLAPLLDDADETIRVEAIRALGGLGEASDASVPKIVDALVAGSAAVRAAALDALVLHRAAAPDPALRALSRILEAQDDPRRTRPWLDALFWDLGPFAMASARAALASDEPFLAAAGAEVLGASLASDAESGTALLAALAGRPAVVRRHAATALGALGAAGPDAQADALISLLADRESRAQVEAAGALRQILVDLAERPARPSKAPAEVQSSIGAALDWLAAHQDDDGRFDCDGFEKHDPADAKSGGRGTPENDTGITGLAALAFLRSGATGRGDLAASAHDLALRRALRFLCASQGADGCVGTRDNKHWIYGHAIASLALSEAWFRTRNPLCRDAAQRALDFLAAARNPASGWRYDIRPEDTDTSVNGWCVQALRAGERSGLRVDRSYAVPVLAYLDRVSHPERGDVAYQPNAEGKFQSARTNEALPHFPPEQTRAMTASACMQRLLLGREAKSDAMLRVGLDRVVELPPATEPAGRIDLYSWLAGAEALHLVGGEAWTKWKAALRTSLLTLQCGPKTGARAGSFEPCDPWCAVGGRLYMTAAATLCLEIHQGAVPGLPSDPTRTGRGLRVARALDAAAKDAANHESVRDAARSALDAAKGP